MAAALAFQENSLYNKKQYARFGPGGTAFAARIVKGLNFLANQKKMVNDITSMDVDFSKWYTDIVKKAELMDYSSVKGCMIIEPYGYAIWENIQHELDDRFKATGSPERLHAAVHPGIPPAEGKRPRKGLCA